MAGANVAGLLLGAIVFANFFLLTLYVQEVLGWSALQGRADVPRDRRIGGHLGRRLAGADDAVRAHAGHGRRDSSRARRRMLWYTQIPVDGHYWSDLLPGLPARGLRTGVRVHPGLDRRPRRRRAGGGGPRVGNDQHGAADRRSDRRRGRIVRGDRHFNHLVSSREAAAPAALTTGYQWAFWVMDGVGFVGLIASSCYPEVTRCAGDPRRPRPRFEDRVQASHSSPAGEAVEHAANPFAESAPSSGRSYPRARERSPDLPH